MRPTSIACIVLSIVVIGLIIALSCRPGSASSPEVGAAELGGASAQVSLPLFEASLTFAGPRKGYVYKTGDQGVGYYLEEEPQQQKQPPQQQQQGRRSPPPPAVAPGMPPPSSGSGAASAQSSNDVERGQLRSRRATGVDTTSQAVARRRQSNGFWDDEL